MPGRTEISWATDTWNPVVGCSWVSEECDRCYAAQQTAGRLSGQPLYAGLAVRPNGGGPARFTGEIRLAPARLDQPLRWKAPRLIFVNSMSDLFHQGVLESEPVVDRFGTPWPFLAEVVAVMVRADWHRFMVLTKRPQLMAAVLGSPRFRLDVNAILLRDGHPVMAGGMTDRDFAWPDHLWWGTSIGLDRYTFRADHLRRVHGGVRFISAEPLLGPLPSLDLTGIGWVIVGGESQPGARPMHPAWARDLRDRCQEAGIPFHFKQLGAVLARELGASDTSGSKPEDHPADLRIQEMPGG